jgi:hypothetical protein
MIMQDDRTPEQKKTHTWLIIGTDSFMSGWGKANGGKSYAAWACLPEKAERVFSWVSGRSDMKRVRESSEAYGSKWRPSGIGHAHIYVVENDHPALA